MTEENMDVGCIGGEKQRGMNEYVSNDSGLRRLLADCAPCRNQGGDRAWKGQRVEDQKVCGERKFTLLKSIHHSR